MKWLFIGIIKFYQHTFRHLLMRSCLFRENCSDYVMRITREKGSAEGIRAFMFRLRTCRGGYQFVVSPECKSFAIRLIDGTIIDAEEASPDIFDNRN